MEEDVIVIIRALNDILSFKSKISMGTLHQECSLNGKFDICS